MVKRDWDNTVIEVLDLEHGQKVKAFWLKVCNDKDDVDWYSYDSFGKYYGSINDEFSCYDRSVVNYNSIQILTLEQAEELLPNEQQPELTFPREMLCWDYVEEDAVIDMVFGIFPEIKSINKVIGRDGMWKYSKEIPSITKEPEIFEINIDVAKEELATLHNCKPEQIKLIM